MRDKHNTPLAFGDEVYCYIPGSPGMYGFIIGEMSYSNGDVVCLALSGQYSGMPVNTGHLQRMAHSNPELAAELRAKYLATTPGAFKEI